MRLRIGFVLAFATACATAPLLTKAELEQATCTGVGGRGVATITCELNGLVPTERLKIVEIGRDRIVLVRRERAEIGASEWGIRPGQIA